ncbi:MAG: carbohydrate ABC transporter permease [Spirochaetales bacterium]|nr:carbohydrate ABC transporter permease [Spirochaetales bacterium]
MMMEPVIKIKGTSGERIFDIVNNIIMTLILIITLYPFLNVLALSFNSSMDSVKGGITIFPRVFTLDNYITIIKFGNIPRAFMISVLRTFFGTTTSLIACSMVAYALSRKNFSFRKILSPFLAITLYVSGGLIPVFLLIRDIKLMNNFLVYILPPMVNAFYIFMIRTYMDNLPEELFESAKMDGANDFAIFYKIMMPLCKPVLATIALFIAVAQWNTWFDTYIYCGSKPELSTLQYELMKILQNAQLTAGDAAVYANQAMAIQTVTPDSIKMAITIITITPILVVYPFLQGYFVEGMTLGAVKG